MKTSAFNLKSNANYILNSSINSNPAHMKSIPVFIPKQAPANYGNANGHLPRVKTAMEAPADARMQGPTEATITQSLSTKSHVILHHSKFFSTLSEPLLTQIIRSVSERTYIAGNTICDPLDKTPGHFHIVAHGEVSVSILSVEGKESVLATLRAGDYFGESSIFDSTESTSTVRAVKTAKILTIRHEDFR